VEVTRESIIAGLKNHDEWVLRAISVLSSHGNTVMPDRHKFMDYKNTIRVFDKLDYDVMQEARELCIKYADTLLGIATTPSFSFRAKMFVMTGRLIKYTRPQLTEKLRALGAYVTTSVNRNTDVVVVGKKAGVKYDRAVQYGCMIWDEAELERNLATPASKI
jgi:NAD-dependent DNA ligase